jgi:hypothetical protein
MKTATLRIPDLGFIAVTRVALGVGLGLLFCSQMDERTRRGAGIALVAVGLVTTIPIALRIFGGDE